MATVAQPLRIAIDVDGGDHGAAVTLPAAAQFLARRPDAHLVLVGTEASLASAAKIIPASVAGRVSHVIATEVVGMDESPALSLKNKKNSSLRLALNAVKDGQAAACVSAGNTGALMATARFVLKTLPGIDRPAIASLLPTHKGHGKEGDGGVLMLDLGANVDCTPEHLRQFAIMGAALSSALTDKPRPTVALLNIGEEEIKGNDIVKEAAELIRATFKRLKLGATVKVGSAQIDRQGSTTTVTQAGAKLGIDWQRGERGVVGTANGTAAAFRVNLRAVRVGDVEINNVDALVSGADMPFILLGNSFLARFSMRRDSDVMRLELR